MDKMQAHSNTMSTGATLLTVKFIIKMIELTKRFVH